MRVSLIKHQTNQVASAAVPACSLSWHWSHIRDSDSMKPIGNEIQSQSCRSVGNNNKKEKKRRRCEPHGVLVCNNNNKITITIIRRRRTEEGAILMVSWCALAPPLHSVLGFVDPRSNNRSSGRCKKSLAPFSP